MKDRERSKKALTYIKNNLIDSDYNMHLTVESLIDRNNKNRNNIVTSSNNITLRKVILNHMDMVICIWIKINCIS